MDFVDFSLLCWLFFVGAAVAGAIYLWGDQ